MNIFRPYIDLFFPAVCACCGTGLKRTDHRLCLWCKKQRFAPPKMDEFQILPDAVQSRFALWSFDKGGYLQDLLHSLKYNCLRKVGEELGETLGDRFLNVHKRDQFEQFRPLIVPVPLHKSKLRKRGYNQAEALATGFSKVTGWPIAHSESITRVKKTNTQTGLTAELRARNLKHAFRLNDPSLVTNRTPVIVDDVFTTGATTFELARVLKSYSWPAIIVTVAQA